MRSLVPAERTRVIMTVITTLGRISKPLDSSARMSTTTSINKVHFLFLSLDILANVTSSTPLNPTGATTSPAYYSGEDQSEEPQKQSLLPPNREVIECDHCMLSLLLTSK